MMTLVHWLGLLVVLCTAGGILLFSSRKKRQQQAMTFRTIQSIENIRQAVSLSVEDGSRIHVSLGNADITEMINPSAFVGLQTLEWISQLSTTGDQPPICTAGNGGFALLSQDELRTAGIEQNAREKKISQDGQLAGVSAMSYAIGACDVMRDEGIGTNLFIGNFDSEAAFLSLSSAHNDVYAAGASNAITAQSVFMATARDVLIGEELFAIPAYLAGKPFHQASLRMQDILRLGIGAILIGGALLGILGSL